MKGEAERQNEIRIRDISPSVKQDLDNIASNMGVTLSQLMRPKLREIADSYPDHLKRQPDFLD